MGAPSQQHIVPEGFRKFVDIAQQQLGTAQQQAPSVFVEVSEESITEKIVVGVIVALSVSVCLGLMAYLKKKGLDK